MRIIRLVRPFLRWLLQRRFRRPTLVFLACLSLLGGLTGARYGLGAGFGWLLLASLWILVRGRRQDALVLLAVVIACFGAGAWRGSVYARRVATYDSLFKHTMTLTATAQDDAVYGDRSQLAFTAAKVRLVAPYHANLVGVIAVSGFGVPAVFRGDRVQVSGELYPTLGGNQATVRFAELRVLAHHATWIDDVREMFVAGMQSALPEPAASFGLGLLIGQRNTLPADVSQQLTMVGLTHIIAVSGYNLTIMLQVARRLFARRSKFQATALFVALIGVFLLLTGSSPSLVRAAIVSLLGIAAWYYGREIKPHVLLVLSAAVTAFANPLYAWGNVSWCLSFLAFAGVLLLAPLLTTRIFTSRPPPLVLAVLVESLCAEALTVPYVLYIFGQASLVSLPANVLVVALVPLAMLLSLVAGLAGMLVPQIAGWLAWPARELLTYMLDTAHLLSRIPHAFVQNIGFSFWQVLAAYGIVCVLAVGLWRGKSEKCAIITDEIAEMTEGG